MRLNRVGFHFREIVHEDGTKINPPLVIPNVVEESLSMKKKQSDFSASVEMTKGTFTF